MYRDQQNKCYPQKCLMSEKLQLTPALCNEIFHRNNKKNDLCYYWQLNSLKLKSSVASEWESKHLWRLHLFCW